MECILGILYDREVHERNEAENQDSPKIPRYEAILLFRISDDNIVGKEKVSKWNKNAETAIYQIREKQYPEFLKQYTGKILLVGISYDKETKEHACKIEA